MRLLKAFSAVLIAVALCAVMAFQYGALQVDAYAQSDPTQPTDRAVFVGEVPFVGEAQAVRFTDGTADSEFGAAEPQVLPNPGTSTQADPTAVPRQPIASESEFPTPTPYPPADREPGDAVGNATYPGNPTAIYPEGLPMTPARGVPSGVKLKTTVQRLGHLSAAQVADVVNALFSDRAGFVVIAEPTTNTLIIRSDEQTLEGILQLVDQLEQTQQQIEAESEAAATEADAAVMIAAEQSMMMNEAVEMQQQMAHSAFTPVEAADPEAAGMWNELQQLEERSHAVARNLQAALTMYSGKHPKVHQIRQELRSILERAFQHRLQVQEYEAAVLQERLSIVHARLRRRAELRDRIIERRMNELTGSNDETLWDPAPQQRAMPALGDDPYGPQEPLNPNEFAPGVSGAGFVHDDGAISNLSPIEDTPTFAMSAVRVEYRHKGQPNDPVLISGTIFTAQKLIVTAFPSGTIPDGIGIQFETGETTGAQLLGTHASSGLSLLFAGDVPDNITGLNLARSNPRAGEKVRLAWFAPDSELEIDPGVVSATERTVEGREALQIDIATHPTAAGAPLVNLQGQLIGIAQAVDANASITFAAPTDAIRQLLSLVDTEPGGAGPPDRNRGMPVPNPFATAGSAEDLPMADVAPLDLSVRKRLVESRLRYRIAEREHERMEILRENNAASQTEVERAQDAVQQARAALDETERLIRLQLTQLDARIRVSEHLVEIAQHQADGAEQANERVPGAVPIGEFLKLTLELERAKAGHHELLSLRTFLADSLPEDPLAPEPAPIDGFEINPPSRNTPQPGPDAGFQQNDFDAPNEELPTPIGPAFDSTAEDTLLDPAGSSTEEFPQPEPEAVLDPFSP